MLELDSKMHEMFYKRTLSETVLRVSQRFPVLLITGPRQVGKTTLLKSCADDTRSYVSLDDLDARALAQSDPMLFLQTYRAPLIIDEIQYAPGVLNAIKIIVDQKQQNGLFWLTGSQKFPLMKGITESLAGRVAILDLLGLSQSELEERPEGPSPFLPTLSWVEEARLYSQSVPSLMDVYKRIWQGGFPKAQDLSFSERDIFYRSYIQTYLQRDVAEILKVSDILTFQRFLQAVAARTAQLLNYNDLSRDVGIDNKTAKAWLSVLEVSGLVSLLYPYHSNITKRLIKAPKLYFLDTGLCTYLTKWPTIASLEAGAMTGALLETYVFVEILKSYWHRGLSAPLFYYRDHDQNEIDFLIESGDTLYPVECKKTATPSSTGSKNFSVLSKFRHTTGHGAVVCFVEKDIPLSREVAAIPVGYL